MYVRTGQATRCCQAMCTVQPSWDTYMTYCAAKCVSVPCATRGSRSQDEFHEPDHQPGMLCATLPGHHLDKIPWI